MERAGAPAFDLGNANRHDFGPYQIQRHISAFSTDIPDLAKLVIDILPAVRWTISDLLRSGGGQAA